METLATCNELPVARPKANLAEALSASSIYHTYERAFSGATGMPVALRAPGSWKLPFRGKRSENRFCALMAKRSNTCASCLRLQEKLGSSATRGVCTLTCPYGLSESAVPVKNGEQLVALLQTGQVFRKAPTAAQFRQVVKTLGRLDPAELRELEEAYFATPILTARRYESILQLLVLFASQLSAASNELLIREANSEPPLVSRAKAYIRAHTAEDISLSEVAHAVNTSSSYFCRVFRKTTGINFTHYLSRVRLERAKQLLLNPNVRVSEVAYEVGFQSLTQFNRVFKKLLGESPTAYRSQHAAVTAG